MARVREIARALDPEVPPRLRTIEQVFASSIANRRYSLWLVAAFAFCVIVFGAFVRLSNAGLSCPDWPTCYGRAAWPTAAHEIADQAATAIRPLQRRPGGAGRRRCRPARRRPRRRGRRRG